LTESDRKDKKRHILVVLRILVAGVALYLAFRGEDLGELSKVLLRLNIWIFAAAIVLFLVAQVLFVIRWRLLLRILSIHISLGVGLKLHFLGWFYNNCLPSSVGGDLVRAWYITKHVEANKRASAALSVFFDRFIGLTGMLLMATACYWLISVEGRFTNEQNEVSQKVGIFEHIAEYRLILVTIAAVIVGIFCIILANKSGRALLTKAWRRLWGIAMKIFAEGIAAVKLYGQRPVTIICTIGLTVLLQSISIAGFCLLGRDLGIEIPIKYYFVFFPISWLIGTIPVSIGGLGIMEGSLKLMFLRLGVGSKYASAIAVCQRLVWWVCSLPGVIVHLSGTHLPCEKGQIFVDSPHDMD